MENIISYVTSPAFSDWISILKAIFMVLGLLFSVSIFFLLSRTAWFKFFLLYDIIEFLTFRPAGARKVEKTWNKIIARLNTDLESEYKLAIIEADNLLNETLKKMGFTGETLGERLKKITLTTLPNIEKIKAAHQVRNNIVHDPNYKLFLDETKTSLAIYEQTFRDLQIF